MKYLKYFEDASDYELIRMETIMLLQMWFMLLKIIQFIM